MPPTGGNRGSLPRAPSVRGAPTSAELFQGSLFHPSLEVRFAVLLISSQPAFLLLASAADANFKNAHFILCDCSAAAD